MNFWKKLTVRGKVTATISVVVILCGLGIGGYYLRKHFVGADVISATQNTSCVIKVVDNDTNQPIADATAFFYTMPQSYTSSSDLRGCVSMPEELVGKDNYYQAFIYHRDYQQDSRPVHIKLIDSVMSGKDTIQEKLTKRSVSASQSNVVTKTNSVYEVASNEVRNPFNIQLAKADDQTVQLPSIIIQPSDGDTGDVFTDPTLVTIKITIDGKIVFNGNLEEFNRGQNFQVPKSSLKHDAEKGDYAVLKIELSAPDYYTSTETYNCFVGASNNQIEYGFYLFPKKNQYSTQYTGVAKGVICNNESKTFNVSYYTKGADLGSATSYIKDQQIQDIADSLTTTICALEKSDPKPDLLPVPNLVVFIGQVPKYFGNTDGVYAFTGRGESNIYLLKKVFCTDKSNSQDIKACIDSQQENDLRKYAVIHEYGHILDIGRPGSGKISGIDFVGDYSGDANFLTLYSSAYRLAPSCPYTAYFVVTPNYGGVRCYFMADILEFWAESFAYLITKSLPSELGISADSPLKFGINIDDSVLTDRGPVPYYPYNYPDFQTVFDQKIEKSERINTYLFWKKSMATSLGVWENPMLLNDDGLKAVAYDKNGNAISGNLHTEGLPPNDLGGPFGKTYSTGEILSGDALKNPHLKVTFKQLPKDYQSTGLHVGVAAVCPGNVCGFTTYFNNIGVLPGRGLICLPGSFDNSMNGSLVAASLSSKRLRSCRVDHLDKTATAVITLKSGLELKTTASDQEVVVDLTKFPACPTNNQMSIMPGSGQKPITGGSPAGSGSPLSFNATSGASVSGVSSSSGNQTTTTLTGGSLPSINNTAVTSLNGQLMLQTGVTTSPTTQLVPIPIPTVAITTNPSLGQQLVKTVVGITNGTFLANLSNLVSPPPPVVSVSTIAVNTSTVLWQNGQPNIVLNPTTLVTTSASPATPVITQTSTTPTLISKVTSYITGTATPSSSVLKTTMMMAVAPK
ncbi:MAG: hypothetical protein NTW79_03400 [Candidatus Berkelbacteria bacterium]|nr:hypothetical protein [Candidatus Berkelbacteria bacterium]